jgi:hypothetical protein
MVRAAPERRGHFDVNQETGFVRLNLRLNNGDSNFSRRTCVMLRFPEKNNSG